MANTSDARRESKAEDVTSVLLFGVGIFKLLAVILNNCAFDEVKALMISF